MERAFVQHTFIAIFGEEPAEEVQRRRAKSADISSKGRMSVEELENLTEVLQLAHGEYKVGSRAVVQPARSEMLKSKLRQIGSNSSVSTMAPDDDDTLEEPQESCLATPKATMKDDFQHSRVPRQHNLAEEFEKACNDTPPTTLMIRNIPNRYTQRDLIKELEGLGFAGTFDFFYAPIDMGTMGNVGYAFVNFTSPQYAVKCQDVVNGYMFKKHQSRKKIATVSVAHLQGLEANLAHYQNAVVNGRSRARRCGPVVLTKVTESQ